MQNGHSAGMQSGKDFGEREQRIRQQRMDEMKNFDSEQSGAHADTTYRDKKGRKLDMLNQFMIQDALREGKV